MFGALRQLAERMIPFPAQLAETPVVRALLDQGIIGLTPRGSRYVWEARVWECQPTA